MKKTLIWIFAVVLTLAASRYQRKTGPTYPKQFSFSHQGQDLDFILPRSHGGSGDCPVQILLPDSLAGRIVYRRFPSEVPWDTLQMNRSVDTLTVFLPHQPPAGKLEYHVQFYKQGRISPVFSTGNVVIRFRGDVPVWALLPHILFIFTAMLLSNATGLFALFKLPGYKRMIGWTILIFVLGGFVFGPIVQKFAFGAFWTGWPNGMDLTDNKVLLAMIPWLIAWITNRKAERRWLVILAAFGMLIIFLIPHSMNGSELNYETGQVETGR